MTCITTPSSQYDSVQTPPLAMTASAARGRQTLTVRAVPLPLQALMVCGPSPPPAGPNGAGGSRPSIESSSPSAHGPKLILKPSSKNYCKPVQAFPLQVPDDARPTNKPTTNNNETVTSQVVPRPSSVNSHTIPEQMESS